MKIQIIIPALILFVNVYSQYDYKPGYIIKNDGETEEGLIYFKTSGYNATTCNFRKDKDAEPVIFSPGDIKAYRFTDSKYFESKKVPINNQEILVFLECLISGKSTIYFTQLNSNNYYFIEIEGELHEINNALLEKVRDGVAYQVPSKQYVRVLKYLYKDCPSVVQKLDQSDFSKKTLINLSREYHEYVCKDEPCIIYEKKIPKNRFLLGFDLSYGISSFKFADPHFDMSMKPKNLIQAGVFSQINLTEEGTFNLQGSVRFYSYENEILKYENLNNYSLSFGGISSDVHYKYSILKPEIQIKYKMTAWKIAPIVSAGIFTNIFLTDEGYIYNERIDATFALNSGGFLGDVNKGHREMLGLSGEIGIQTGMKQGGFSLTVFYETFLNTPFQNTFNFGLRCGYFFKL